jgi:hypothetical protein
MKNNKYVRSGNKGNLVVGDELTITPPYQRFTMDASIHPVRNPW